MKGPKVVIPEDPTNKDSFIVLADLGRLTLVSNQQNSQDPNSQYYNSFQVSLSQLKAHLLPLSQKIPV